jgi:hypothetical protein
MVWQSDHLRYGSQLAFGKVVRVARRYKSTFLDLLRNLEALRAAVEKEPPCLLGRDEHNNTLLHLLIGGVLPPSKLFYAQNFDFCAHA